jgi:hypothetical protein
MTTIPCPWCDEPVELDAALAELTCADCRVTVEIAADPAAPLAAAA